MALFVISSADSQVVGDIARDHVDSSPEALRQTLKTRLGYNPLQTVIGLSHVGRMRALGALIVETDPKSGYIATVN